MGLRSKRRRRLAVLLAAVVLLGAVGATVYFVRMRQIRQETAQKRSQGLAAFQKGDYFTAVHALGTYLHRVREPELDVLYKYAQARREVQEPRGAHLVQAAGVLRHLLTLDPGNAKARQDLLDLYVQLGYSTEAIGTADSILKSNPKDAKALFAKATALGQLRRFREAIEVIGEHHRLKPLDLDAWVLTFAFLHGLEKSPEDLIARAQEAMKAHKDDPRARWLVAFAYRCANDRDKTAQWCEPLTKIENIDPDLAIRTAGLLDDCGRSKEASDLLDRVYAATSDTRITVLLAHRLWQRGRYEDLVQRLAGVISSPKEADSELLGLCALSLIRTGHSEKAEPLAAVLAKRKGDNRAAAWADALLHALLAPPADPMKQIAVWRKVLERAPRHPYFCCYLANAYEAIGETDKAIQSLDVAARLAPSWALPRVEKARLLLSTGRSIEAFTTARAVLAGPAPGNLPAAVILAEAWDANLRENQPEAAAKLLALVRKIQDKVPGEPRTLVILVKLLARTGETDEARKAVRSVAESEETPSQGLLLAMAEASRTFSLGTAEDCLRRCEKEYGMTWELASARARSLAQSGNPQGGLKLLEAAAKAAKPEEKKSYRLAVARYLESQDDERAAGAWVDLSAAYPDDPHVLHIALNARSVWSKKDFVDKTIEKLKALLGPDSTSWRLPRARWLLVFDRSEKAVRRAEDLLEELVRPASDSTGARLLLAHSQEQLGNLSGALGNLTVAAYRNPQLLSIRLQLAALQQRQGNKDAARATIERILASTGIGPEQVLKAASLLAAQGDVDRAITKLEQALAYQLATSRQQAGDPNSTTQPAGPMPPGTTPATKDAIVKAFELLSARGDAGKAIPGFEQAITELLKPQPDAESPTELLLGLAKLCARRRDAAKRDIPRAKVICRKLMEKPDVATIGFTADLYASLGQKKDADAALARLKELDLKPGLAQLILGLHYSRRGGVADPNTDAGTVPDEAISHYQKAAQEAPTNLLAHHLLTAAFIRRGERSRAIEAARTGLKHCPGDKAMQFLLQHQDLLALIKEGAALRPMAAAIVESPDDRAAAADTLRIIGEAKAKKQSTPEVARRLRQIAERKPRFWPLQALLIRLYQTVRQPSDALDVATRAMQSFPTAAEPARLAAEALAATGKWAEALSVSREWQKRAGGQSVDADVMTASVLLRLGQASAAVAQLERHVAEALKDPDANVRVLLTHASALILAKKLKEAENLLFPLLAKSSQWRLRWMTLSLSISSSAEAAGNWLARVVPLIPENAARERFALASAWKMIGERFHDKVLSARARHILEELTAAAGAPAGAYQLLALINEADGNLTAAEANYRRALHDDPNMALSANNLAMILLQRGGHQKEADKLARQAVEKEPRVAAYHDTLAQVQAKAGDNDAAAKSMGRALRLEPNNLQWHLNLIQILVESGQLAKARKALDLLEAAVTDRSRLPEQVRDALSAFRKAVGGPDATGKTPKGS